MNHVRIALVLVLLGLSLLSACRNRPGNGNGNGGDTLPEDVQKAVNDVVAQLEATGQAIGGAVQGFASVDLSGDDDTFGDCPEVIFIRENNISTFALTFEPGCESDYFGETSVSGGISIVFDRNVGSFEADFDAFTVDGQTTDGGLSVTRGGAGELRTWTGTIDISVTGVGSVMGDIVLEINAATQTISIESASLTLTGADDVSRSVVVEGIVIRPVANGNFIPQAGTVTFEVPNDDPEGPETISVEIEFDGNSPIDGTVRVTFGEGSVANYELPGF